MAGLLETDKFRFPTAGVHEADERLRSALSARHRRDNRQSRHGKNGWWRLGKGQTGVRKNAEKANDAFTSDRFARGMLGGALLPRVRHNGTMRATQGSAFACVRPKIYCSRLNVSPAVGGVD
jgi:hypothetical protein